MRRTVVAGCLGCVLLSSIALATPVDSPILGGTPTKVGDYPQTVAITLGGALCTGTLIAPDWVLTAAHCVKPSADLGLTTQAAVTQAARVHFNALRADGGTQVTAIETIPDPDFNIDALGSHDSGLIHLSEKITDIKPVQLNFDPANAPVGVTVTMVGYGVSNTSTQTAGTEYVVQQTSVSCLLQEGDNANLLCFNQTSGKGKCNGDSGGPSFATVNGKLLEVGVTSFGDPSCTQFGADTRVDAEKAFITGHVPNLYCETDGDCQMGHECFENACITTPFQPTGVGSVCTDNTGCESGECAMNGKDSKCTMDCTTGDKTSCPSGFDCLAAGGGGVCWPTPGASGGCCDVSGHGAPTALLGIGLVGLVLRRRRR